MGVTSYIFFSDQVCNISHSLATLHQMDRAAKLRKLNDFRRRLPHCSASALASVLADIQENGLPDGDISRVAMKDARNLQNNAHTRYGPILQSITLIDKDNAEAVLYIAHPMALLVTIVSDCEKFASFFHRKLRAHPCSHDNPWNLVLYTDEVTPGNPLATMNKRKFQAIYWTFLEFGNAALSREEFWFILATEYSIRIKNLAAGMSQVIGELVKVFFPTDEANFALAGCLLPIDVDGVRLWCKLTVLIQDGGAHKAVFHSRGDAASKFCLLCLNLFTETSNLVDEDGDNLLVCNVIKHGELVQATSNNLRKTARYLESRADTTPPPDFVEMQQALGVTHHKHALLLDRSLDDICDPVDIYMHDWMHGNFVDGVFNVLLFLVLESMISRGYNNIYTTYSEFIANWKWPSRLHSAHLAEIFSESRSKKHRAAKQIKCQASDGLSLLGVTRRFTSSVLKPLDEANIASDAFLNFVEVIEIIIAASKSNVAPGQLLEAVETFLASFVAAFGFEWMTPKFHWLLHMHRYIGKWGTRFLGLLNCFCLERKHRVPKRYATDLTNTSNHQSKSLLMEVTSHHIGQLRSTSACDFSIGLIDPKKPSKRIRNILARVIEDMPVGDGDLLCSLHARYSEFGLCSKHDVVLFRDAGDRNFRVAKIQLHVAIVGVTVSVCAIYNNHTHDDEFSIWEPVSDSASFIETGLILEVCVYSELADGKLAVLLPYGYR